MNNFKFGFLFEVLNLFKLNDHEPRVHSARKRTTFSVFSEIKGDPYWPVNFQLVVVANYRYHRTYLFLSLNMLLNLEI